MFKSKVFVVVKGFQNVKERNKKKKKEQPNSNSTYCPFIIFDGFSIEKSIKYAGLNRNKEGCHEFFGKVHCIVKNWYRRE